MRAGSSAHRPGCRPPGRNPPAEQLAAPDPPQTCSVILPDGRRLGYVSYGADRGKPLFYFHGLPGSRYECQLIAPAARALGVTVVALDRPGYGLTPLHPERSIRGWTRDVAGLADHLEHDRFDVIGVSGGAPCALACAHEMPSRVTAVGLVAGLGPMEVGALRRAMRPGARLGFALADRAPWILKAGPGPALTLLSRRRPDLLVRLLAALNARPDRAILLDKMLFPAFTFSIRECFRQGLAGSLEDLRLFGQPWGFRLEDIRQPTWLWHGTRDRIVPPSHSEYMQSRLARSSIEIVPEEGHFSLPIRHIHHIIHTIIT
jgi:pimeloyl-ACP methyl ester carboxylesterase